MPECQICEGIGKNQLGLFCENCEGKGYWEENYSDDYYDDEWYEDEYRYDEDYDRSIKGQDYGTSLYKAHNGHLRLYSWVLTCYQGQDWGEASGWHETDHELKSLKPHVFRWIINLGKKMEPHSSKNIYWDEIPKVRKQRKVKLAPVYRWSFAPDYIPF